MSKTKESPKAPDITFRHQTATPLYDQNTETIMGGLSKREYASIHIAAGLAANGRPQMSFTADKDDIYIIPKELAKQAVEIADELFNQLEK